MCAFVQKRCCHNNYTKKVSWSQGQKRDKKGKLQEDGRASPAGMFKNVNKLQTCRPCIHNNNIKFCNCHHRQLPWRCSQLLTNLRTALSNLSWLNHTCIHHWDKNVSWSCCRSISSEPAQNKLWHDVIIHDSAGRKCGCGPPYSFLQLLKTACSIVIKSPQPPSSYAEGAQKPISRPGAGLIFQIRSI